MDDATLILLNGLCLFVFGGGTVFLLLAAGERIGRWINEQADKDKDQ